MTRTSGFPVADLDVGLMNDPKVKALVRRQHDEKLSTKSLLLYLTLVLESWGAGERLTLDQAAPLWITGDLATLAADLEAVGLVDADGRLPETSWTSWYGVADSRRTASRNGGVEGNRRRYSREPIGTRSGTDPRSDRSVPTVPTVPTVPRADAREAKKPRASADRPFHERVPRPGTKESK